MSLIARRDASPARHAAVTRASCWHGTLLRRWLPDASTHKRVVTMLLSMAATATSDRVGRSATAIRFPEELHQRLRTAAGERHYSINFMVVKAVEEFLDRLIPVDELKLTRD